MYHPSSNPQAIRSKDRMIRGLLTLMEVELYPEITVTQICQEAEVSRQTFYRNFDSKEDILIYHLHCLLDTYLRNLHTRDSRSLYAQSLFEHLPFSHRLLTLLWRNHLFFLLREVLLDYMEVVRQYIPFAQALDGPSRDYFSDFVIDTCLSVLSRWVENDFRESPKTLGRIITLLFSGLTGTYAETPEPGNA